MKGKVFGKLMMFVAVVFLLLPVFGTAVQVKAADYTAYLQMTTNSKTYKSDAFAVTSEDSNVIKLEDFSLSSIYDIDALRLVTTIPADRGSVYNITVYLDGAIVYVSSEVVTNEKGCVEVDFPEIEDEVDYLPEDIICVTFEVEGKGNSGNLNDCVLTYNANGALSKPESQYFAPGDTVVISWESPDKPGDVFLGWAREANAVEVDFKPGDEACFYGDMTLYAVWENATCMLIYEPNGGTMMSKFQQCRIGRSVAITEEVPVKAGYEFKGWSTSDTSKVGQYEGGDTFTIQKATVLYAVWGSISYRIVYNSNGGSGKISNVKGSTNQDITLAAGGYTKSYSLTLYYNYSGGKTKTTNYTVPLLGWMTSADGILKYNLGDRVRNLAERNGDIIYLYAKWGQKDVSLPVLKRNGYEFRGWSKSKKSLTAEFEPGNNCLLDRNMKLYAVWEEVVSSDSNTIKNGMMIKTSSGKYVVKDKNRKTIYFDKPNSKDIKSVTIPKSIEYKGVKFNVVGIQSHAFYNCKKLRTVTIQAKISEFPEYAFYNCVVLNKLNFPGAIKKVGAKSFVNCKSLSTLSIGKVQTIAKDAFVGCEKLKFSGNINANLQKYALQYGLYRLETPKLTKTEQNGIFVFEWKKVKNADGYEIFRKVGNDSYEKLGDAALDKTALNLPKYAVQSGSYCVRIRAYYKTSNGENVYSSYSNEIKFSV